MGNIRDERENCHEEGGNIWDEGGNCHAKGGKTLGTKEETHVDVGNLRD